MDTKLDISLQCGHTPGVTSGLSFNLSNKELADYIDQNLDYDQLILEYWKESDPNSGWIHCSFNTQGNRKQYLRAYKENGSTKYEPV